MTPYKRSEIQLIQAIPNLLNMEVLEGLNAIDDLVKSGWMPDALSFNPSMWFQLVKHEQKFH